MSKRRARPAPSAAAHLDHKNQAFQDKGPGVFLEGDEFYAKGEIVADKEAGHFLPQSRDECESCSVGSHMCEQCERK